MKDLRVLVVEDEENMRHLLNVILEREGYRVTVAENGKKALEAVSKDTFDFILTDIRMPEMDGFGFLASLHQYPTDALCIVMSAYGTMDTAIEAMKRGAYDYISKPFKPDEVALTLRKAAERQQLVREVRALKSVDPKKHGLLGIISKNDRMREIFQTIERIADFKSTVLILGESGTGKELIARAIHTSSTRKSGPFVAVNCGAIPENLLETELFGHMKGAFTGATGTKKGLFEEAQGGTIFLDEIGELPLNLQVKLLRVLQEEEIRRVGDTRNIPLDVRVLAATSRNLEEEVRAGRFREDLFYRLNVFTVKVPPLRDRKEDIPLLVEHFMRKFIEKFKLSEKTISESALFALQRYAWPGNVRELENSIERAMVLSEGSRVEPGVLSKEISGQKPTSRSQEATSYPLSIKKAVREIERELIVKALSETKGNRTHAAKLLEISHRALLYKMKEYQISDEGDES